MKNNGAVYQPPAHTGLEILWVDAHLLVVQKPAGLLSVPGRGPEKQDCLLNRCQAETGPLFVAHRLDMSTSGIILFARNKAAQRHLNRQFADRQIDKTYTAVVDGSMENDCGSIDAPIMPDWPNRPKQKIDPDGRASLTHYRVISRSNECTRVQLMPVTGRSHQLRIHLMSLGHAILGDDLYAPDPVFHRAERLLLHATSLCFTHPASEDRIHIDSPAPF